MSDYYIRTPDRDEQRGPFDHSQLLTLAEAGQITQDTLYYDDSKEEWVPIASNADLKAQVFPEREKLKLKVQEPVDEETTDSKRKKKKKDKGKKVAEEKEVRTVTQMLADAEKEPDSVRIRRKLRESLQKAIFISNNGLSLILLLYAFMLIAPHMAVVHNAISSWQLRPIFDYPLLALGLLDFVMAILMYFGAREMHSYDRARSMLTFGFGVYIGWSLGDFNIMFASGAAGLGAFCATLSKKYTTAMLMTVIGLGGSLVLAYYSFVGYFTGFLNSVYIEIPFFR